MTGQANRTLSGQAQPVNGNQTTGRRGLRDWLAQTPDADTPAAAPAAAGATPQTPPVTEPGRPRKAERRAARRREFFAARRGEAATARARFEVAADHLRAVATDRDLEEATTQLERIARRRT